MDGRVLLRAAKSWTASGSGMTRTLGSRLLCVAHQVCAVLARPASSLTVGSRHLTPPPAGPAVTHSAHCAAAAGGRVVGIGASRQASSSLVPACSRAFSTTRTTQLCAPVFSSMSPACARLGTPSPPMTVTPAIHPSSLLQVTPSPHGLIPRRGRAQIYYRPSAWKRVNKHGIERRLRTPGGVAVLWRRFLKKRHCLTPFDRILPGTYRGQILPAHHLKYNQHLVRRDVRKKMNEVLRAKKY